MEDICRPPLPDGDTQHYYESLFLSELNGGAMVTFADDERTISYFSDSFLHILGYTKEEFNYVSQNRYSALVVSEDWNQARVSSDAGQSGDGGDLEYRLRKKDGSEIWVMEKYTQRTDRCGMGIVISSVLDITGRHIKESEFLQRSRRDALTGLYNKDYATNCIRSYLEIQSDIHTSALFVLDLDNFKKVNDICGHSEGDILLAGMGKILMETFRSMDIAGRAGGDEFIVLMKDVPSEEVLVKKAKLLCETIHQAMFSHSSSITVSASIGIALIDHKSVTYQELSRTADAALDEAKFAGKNTWRIKRYERSRQEDSALHLLPERISPESAENVKWWRAGSMTETESDVSQKTQKLGDSFLKFKMSRNRKFYSAVIAAAFIIFAATLTLSVVTSYLSNKHTYSDSLLTRAEYQIAQTAANISSYGTQAVYLRNNPNIIKLLTGGFSSANEQLLLEKTIADNIWNSLGVLDIFIGVGLRGTDSRFYLQNTRLNDFSGQTDLLIDVSSMDFSKMKYAITICNYENESILAVTSPVIDRNQQTLGYVHLFLSHMVYGLPHAAEDQEHYLFSSETWEVICCDNFINTKVCAERAENAGGLISGVKKISEEGNSVIAYTSFDGKSMLGAVCQDSQYSLVMVTAVNTADMTGAVIPVTIFQGIISLFLLGLLVCVIYIVFTRTTKPVSDMIEQCSQLAAGNDTVEIEAEQDRELEKLAGAFNSYRKKLELAAYTDPFLRIGTRFKCLRDIDLLISTEHMSAFSVYLIDIKEFGKYNDVFSIEIGDRILHTAAARLAGIFDRRLYRINGDVFLGILPRKIDISETAAQIHDCLENKIEIGQAEFNIQCMIGICSYPSHGQTGASLLEKVQSALHQAKQRADINTVVYSNDMIEQMHREDEILNLLRRRLSDRTLEVWYQPIYHVEAGQFVSAEALLRLKDDEDRYLSPFEVIQIAEKNNMVDIVGDYVLEATCSVLKKLESLLNPLEYIQINLSVQQLAQNNYASKALAIIKKMDINPARLGMEITETMLMQSFTGTVETLDELRRSGVRIAMDDFGSGYSSINYLSRLPIDIIKLDKDLVIQVSESDEQFTFIKTVVQLAKIKKINVVAEGVETADVFEKMVACRADCIQGYYFSKPLYETEFMDFVTEKPY